MILPHELKLDGTIKIRLFDNKDIQLPITRPVFESCEGGTIGNFDYGGKPFLKYKGETCFAELLILSILIDNGWEGVWIETYGGTHYLKTMPKEWSLRTEHILIPKEKEEILKNIWKIAETKACFDVFVWKGDEMLFLEAKRSKKDKLTTPQIRFIQGALKYGIRPEQLVIVEWNEKNE